MRRKVAPESVQQLRLRLLFKQAHTASVGAVLGALLCAVLFAAVGHSSAAWVWFLAVTAATLPRFYLYRRFFFTDLRRHAVHHWLVRHGWTAALVGIAWGAVPLIPMPDAPGYVYQLQTLVPGFVLMAGIVSYGAFYSQYMVLLATVGGMTIVSRLATSGAAGVPEAMLITAFLPILALTAKRYSQSLADSAEAKHRAEQLVHELTATNNELLRRNTTLAQQQDVIEQEEALAKHVFRQLTVGGDHKLAGVHSWNQSMGSLSGDLIQTALGPNGQSYVFLGDFTGHGLPAALGALPASSVFLAMAAKGLPIQSIATELNRKLRQLLPVGYFCCAVLVELSPDRRTVSIWNGGLPPVLIRRRGQFGYEKIASHSLPLGVVDNTDFDAAAQYRMLHPGDRLYAYSDGLTEAENIDGEMWGSRRLEEFLLRADLPSPKLPALINAVLEHVNLAPPSDDISVVEVEATPSSGQAPPEQFEGRSKTPTPVSKNPVRIAPNGVASASLLEGTG